MTFLGICVGRVFSFSVAKEPLPAPLQASLGLSCEVYSTVIVFSLPAIARHTETVFKFVSF